MDEFKEMRIFKVFCTLEGEIFVMFSCFCTDYLLAQFGNNWIQQNTLEYQIGRGRRPRPIWQSEEFFESSYFQIGQHVVL